MHKAYASLILLVLIAVSALSLTMGIPSLNAQLTLPSGVKREETVTFDTQICSVANPDNFNPWVIGGLSTLIGVNQVCFSTLYYTNYIRMVLRSRGLLKISLPIALITRY